MNIVGFDTETYLMGAERVAPPIVCGQFAARNEEGEMQSFGLSTGDGTKLYEAIKDLLEDKEVHIVGQKICFDMGVIAHAYEDLLPAIFQAYEDERIHDLPCREKCLNLSEHGSVATVPVPSGKPKRISYSMEALALKYLGVDLSEEKNDEDSWRLHYSQLDGVPFDEFPEEASSYALLDAEHTVGIFEAQEERKENEEGPVSLQTAVFQAGVDFALFLITCTGFPIDPEARAEVVEMVERELAPEKMVRLLKSEILRPGESPRPHKSKIQRAAAAEALGQKVQDVESRSDFSEDEVEKMLEAGVKLTKGAKQSINTKLLRALVEATWMLTEHDPVMTDPTNSNPDGQISCKAEVLQEIVEFDESGILEEYIHRAKLQKIVSTELPRMLDPETGLVADRVHPDFDVMKETSRTSSYGGKLYPSFNCQNVDPRVRQCYVPDEDMVLCSSDYASIELVSAAQVQLDLFGTSALADIINAGKDPHGYLGAQLAYHIQEDFRLTCKEKKAKTSDEIYLNFMECKTHKELEVRKFFKHWRRFAKPTGLGYPGGLGAKTFTTYAKGSFGVTVGIDMAKQLKAIWLATLPEFGLFFDYIVKENIDPVNHRLNDDGKVQTSYAYLSPLGTYRANCTFCQIANGKALQTPTAEGAKKGVFDLVRNQFDETRESTLFGTQTLAFIHDECITHLPREDRQLRNDLAFAATKSMIDSMQPFMPDVEVRAEPALMDRWDKGAEAVFGSDGFLDIWTPEEE